MANSPTRSELLPPPHQHKRYLNSVKHSPGQYGQAAAVGTPRGAGSNRWAEFVAGFRGESRLSTWIYQISRNEAVNAARRRKIVGPPVDDVVLPADDSTNPEATFGKRELGRVMEAAMANLDENFRMALELRYMGERSYEEIAETMGLPIGTVKTYIYRGKAQLKKVLERRRNEAGKRT